MIFLKYQNRLVNILTIAAIILPYTTVVIRHAQTNIKYKFPTLYDLIPVGVRYPYPTINLNISTDVRNKYILSQIDGNLSKAYLYGDLTLSELFVGSPYKPVGKYIFQQSNISDVNDRSKKDIINHFNSANPTIVISTEDININEIFGSHSYVFSKKILPNEQNTLTVYIYKQKDAEKH